MRNRDEGSTAVETAIVFPGMLFVVILCFQFGLIAYSHHVVANAAQSAAVSAAQGGGTGPDVLGSISSITSGASVAVVGNDGDQVTTAGEASVMSILPFIDEITVRARGRATIERFRPEGG